MTGGLTDLELVCGGAGVDDAIVLPADHQVQRERNTRLLRVNLNYSIWYLTQMVVQNQNKLRTCRVKQKFDLLTIFVYINRKLRRH